MEIKIKSRGHDGEDDNIFFAGQAYGQVLAYEHVLKMLAEMPETPELYKVKDEIRTELENVPDDYLDYAKFDE